MPDFHPNCNPGNYLSGIQQTCTTFTKPISFFQLYFTIDLINFVFCHTNAYVWKNISNKQSYANCQGAWLETNCKKIINFVSLLICQGLVKANTLSRYW